MRSEICIVVVGLVVLLFFFFKQKTAYEMRISDWSSDVCSSDLIDLRRQQQGRDPLYGHSGAHLSGLPMRRGALLAGLAVLVAAWAVAAARLGVTGDRKSVV